MPGKCNLRQDKSGKLGKEDVLIFFMLPSFVITHFCILHVNYHECSDKAHDDHHRESLSAQNTCTNTYKQDNNVWLAR